MTMPAPYPSGMTPSKVPYSIGWSSTCIASRFVLGSSDGPFGTPRQQHALPFEPEVVVQMTGKVLLDAEEQPLCRFGLLRPFFGNVHIPGRLRRRFEVALLFIFLENHESVSSFQLP